MPQSPTPITRRLAPGVALALLLATGLACGGQPDPLSRRVPRPTPTPAPWLRGFGAGLEPTPTPTPRNRSFVLPAVAAMFTGELRHGR